MWFIYTWLLHSDNNKHLFPTNRCLLSKEQIKTIVPPNEYPNQTSIQPRVYNLQQAPPLPKTTPRHNFTDIKLLHPILKENSRASARNTNLSTYYNLKDLLKNT